MCYQSFCNRNISTLSAPMEWSLALFVSSIHIRTMCDEQLNNFNTPF
jgi:hypothetical protein